jgi:uncharacterized protein (TIGR03067 family)
MLKALKGNWAVTKIVNFNREMKGPEGMNFIFEGNKLTRTMPPIKGKESDKLTYKVKIDTSKKPYKITMTPDAGGRDHKWIIKIEKGELHLATTRAADFPKDFGGDDVVALLVMKKQDKGKEKGKE